MKVNTKMRYGLRAMLEIAKNYPDKGILQKEIAKNQDISFKYLDHILMALKVAQLIRKISLKEGFELTRSPEEISVLEVYSAFEPNLLIVDCLAEKKSINGCCPRMDCHVKNFWCVLNNKIAQQMREVSLHDLLNNKLSNC